MCTLLSRTLDDQNFSPDSIFPHAFGDGSSSLGPAAMDTDEKPVVGSSPYSPTETLEGQSGSPSSSSPDGSSLASLAIDAPAKTLDASPESEHVQVPGGHSSAEPSSSSPNLLPPVKTLDESSPESPDNSPNGSLYDYEDCYRVKRYSSSHWSGGFYGQQSPARESVDDSSKRSSPPHEYEDHPEEPLSPSSSYSYYNYRFRRQSPHRNRHGWDRNWPSPRRESYYHNRWSYHQDPFYQRFHQSTETMHSINPFWSSEREIKPTGVGAGLRNLGNTCFLNAILQCFTHTVPLVQGLRSYNHPKPCERDTEGFCIFCALCDLVEDSLSSSGRVIEPQKLVDNLSNISSCFRRYQQEDAHEFLQCFLDRLETCCVDSKTNDDMSSQSDKLVERVFGGRLISKLQCCNCSHFSNTYEPLIDLSLEIEDVESLPSALKSFTKVERIEDTEPKFTCENCKEKVSVEKQFILDQTPSVAAFHLKRFKTDGSSVMKIDKHVEYPLELDLGPYTSGSDNENVELKYELYAVVVHVGLTSISGHYFCFIRSSPNTWHRLDDSRVVTVQEDIVLSQDAYILFYARQGTPWFSSILEPPKLCSEPNISNKSPKSVLDNADNTSCPSAVNSDSCEDHEMRDASEGIPTERHEEAKVNVTIETKNASEGISTGRHEESKVNVAIDAAKVPRGLLLNESRCATLVTDTSLSSGASNSNDKTLNYEKVSTSLNNGNGGISEATEGDIFHLVTPPISPSPTKSSDGGCPILPNHLRMEKPTCRKQLNIALEDCKRRDERKEAHRLLARSSGPGSRKKLLAAAMQGSLEGRRTTRRMGSSPYKASPRNNRNKPRHRALVR